MMKFSASYSFRLLVPLCLGIAMADAWACHAGGERLDLALYGCLSVAALLLGALALILRTDHSWSKTRFGLGVAALTLTLGAALCLQQHRTTRVDWSAQERAYRATVYDRPTLRQKHLRCPATVKGHRVVLYLPDDPQARSLQRGDELLFYGRITLSDSNRYDRTALHQGVAGKTFVRRGQWRATGRRHALTLRQRALTCRDAIVSAYRRWGLQGDERAVLAALTVGQTDELTTQLRGTFSAAGVSHVLALSGLHVGLVWGVLTLCLPAYIRRRAGRWARWGAVSAALTAYVFVAGLPPSAVRAVMMCVVWEANRCLSTEYTPRLHSLLSVALLMLLAQPFYLFQVSFQLSVMAVGVILAFHEPLMEACRLRFGHWGERASVLLVPVLGQMGVAPLTLYYFHTFPIYFLVSSVAAVALAQVTVYVALALLLATCWGGWPWLEAAGGEVMHVLLAALIGLAEWVSRLPHSLGRVESFTAAEVAGLYLVILLLYRWAVSPERLRA